MRKQDRYSCKHGGDPASIAFCHRIGLDYVPPKADSPFRVPIACLAAAQANIKKAETASTV